MIPHVPTAVWLLAVVPSLLAAAPVPPVIFPMASAARTSSSSPAVVVQEPEGKRPAGDTTGVGAPASSTELEALADSLAGKLIAAGRTAGLSVTVVRGPDTLVSKGWGHANLELMVPATPETVYRVASITKQFTAALVLRLAAAGTLSLDDAVDRWVPLPDAWRFPETPITLRHLLNHTSGIPSFTESDGFDEKSQLDFTREQVLDLVRGTPLQFRPGTFFSYSNTGYTLLGMVVERATGRSYDVVLRDSLFIPLGLEETRYCWRAPLIENRADGYTRSDSVPGPGALDAPRLVNAPYISMAVPFSGGGLCSTAGDLVDWTRALHGGEVLPDSLLGEMTSEARLNDGRGAGYGLGLGVTNFQGHRKLAHGGNIAGFHAMLSHYPENEGPGDDLTIAVLTNADASRVFGVEQTLARRALGMPAPEVADRSVPGRLGARLSGRYHYVRRGTFAEIRFRDGELYYDPGDREAFRLLYQGTRESERGRVAVFRPVILPLGVRSDFLLPEGASAPSPAHVVHNGYRLVWMKREEMAHE